MVAVAETSFLARDQANRAEGLARQFLSAVVAFSEYAGFSVSFSPTGALVLDAVDTSPARADVVRDRLVKKDGWVDVE